VCVGGLFQREGVPDDRLEPARRRLGQRALGQQLRVPWGEADPPADAVEDHVRPVAAGCLAHLLGPVRLGVVDYGVGAQLPGQVELLLPACSSDGPGAGRVRQLNQQAAETAGRRGVPTRPA
jgi:hypothetical protein